MATDGLPKSVSELLRERLHSFEELEALLRMHAERRDWSARQMAAYLNVDPDDASKALDALVQESLLRAVGEGEDRRWKYAPEPAFTASIDELSLVYASARLDVMNAMTRNALERIRLAAITTFADAFRLGKKGKNG